MTSANNIPFMKDRIDKLLQINAQIQGRVTNK